MGLVNIVVLDYNIIAHHSDLGYGASISIGVVSVVDIDALVVLLV